MVELVGVVGPKLSAPSPRRGIDRERYQRAVWRCRSRSAARRAPCRRSACLGQNFVGREAAEPGVGLQIAWRVVVGKSREMGFRADRRASIPWAARMATSPRTPPRKRRPGSRPPSGCPRPVRVARGHRRRTGCFVRRRTFGGCRGRRRESGGGVSHVGANRVQVALRPRRRGHARKQDRARISGSLQGMDRLAAGGRGTPT